MTNTVLVIVVVTFRHYFDDTVQADDDNLPEVADVFHHHVDDSAIVADTNATSPSTCSASVAVAVPYVDTFVVVHLVVAHASVHGAASAAEVAVDSEEVGDP